jgi:hypothetical protein
MYTADEITAWLEPLFEAAEHTDIDLWAIVEQASVPLAEGSGLRLGCSGWGTEHRSENVEARLEEWPDLPADEVRLAVDWVCFGQLLRHELGWDANYPERPAAS